jgi:hypothetical protein
MGQGDGQLYLAVPTKDRQVNEILMLFWYDEMRIPLKYSYFHVNVIPKRMHT